MGSAQDPARITEVSASELAQQRVSKGIEDSYFDAFSQPPYNEGRGAAKAFLERLKSQTDRPGYRLLIAEEEGEILGFLYGHASEPGQWWHDHVTPKLTSSVVDRWFTDAFVIVELAVQSHARGRGTGSSLLQAVLQDAAQGTALTMTHQIGNPALDFYVRHGWRVLATNFRFSETDAASVVLGIDLQD